MLPVSCDNEHCRQPAYNVVNKKFYCSKHLPEKYKPIKGTTLLRTNALNQAPNVGRAPVHRRTSKS